MSSKQEHSRLKPLALAIHLALAAPFILMPAHAQTAAPAQKEAQPAVKDKKTLPTVNVTAPGIGPTELQPEFAGGQVAKGGRLGLLGNTNFLDTPFNQTSYTAGLIEDTQARSLSDVLINDPSVRLSSARTNINEDFSIRGFTVSAADTAFNGQFGLTPFFRVPIEMAERVEVLKGPSALLNGMPPSGNVGGVINVVPKRAEDDPLTRISLDYISDSMVGPHVDIGRRFGPDKQFGVRINAAYRDGDTAIDKQEQTDQVYALGLDYRGERLRASLDLIYQDQNIDRVVRQFQPGPLLTEMPDAPDSSLNYPGYGRSRTDDTTVAARVEYDATDSVTLYGGLGTRKHDMDAIAGNPTLLNSAGDFESSPAWQLWAVDTFSFESGALICFNTGDVAHKVALNYSKVYQQNDIDFDTFWAARTSNIFNPVYGPQPRVPDALPFSNPSINMQRYQKSDLSSYALADTLSFYEDKLQVTLGIRHQKVKQQTFIFASDTGPYEESKNTPAVGIVFQPQKNVSFYASYIEALSRGASDPNNNVALPPYVAKQYEIGAKMDWGKFGTTIAIYQIERPSGSLIGTPEADQRNRGVELNVFGEITRDVRLLGGLVYMDAELTKTSTGAFEGNDPVAIPHWQANLMVDWDNVLIAGLGLNARVVYTGSQYANQANTLELDSWTRFDIGARYRTNIGGKPVVFRANVENLFDKDYWASSAEGYIYVGSPRTVLLSTTVDF